MNLGIKYENFSFSTNKTIGWGTVAIVVALVLAPVAVPSLASIFGLFA